MPSPAAQPLLHSVRGRLVLLIVALALPAFVIIAWLSWEAHRAQRATAHTELGNTARAVAGLVDAEFERSLAILRTLAGTRAFRERDWETLDATARRVLPGRDRWFVVADMRGRQIVNTRLPRGEAIPNMELAPDYVQAMRAGDVYVSDMVFGPVAQQLVLHIGLPVAEPGGDTLGLNIVMTPDHLGETLDVGRFAPAKVWPYSGGK